MDVLECAAGKRTVTFLLLYLPWSDDCFLPYYIATLALDPHTDYGGTIIGAAMHDFVNPYDLDDDDDMFPEYGAESDDMDPEDYY